ncbi:DUF4386 family protein [Paenibacillus sp. TAF58]
MYYKSKLIPRFIPILGMTGAVLIFLCALLVMFGVIELVSAWGAIFAVPIAANEMILAVWLMVKGFNLSALAALSKRSRSESFGIIRKLLMTAFQTQLVSKIRR